MKEKILKIMLFFVMATAIAIGCKKEVEEELYFKLSAKTLSFAKEGSSQTVTVSTNIQSWVVSVDAGAQAWLTANKEGSGIKITASQNKGVTARTGTIQISGGGLSELIKVQQLGEGAVIMLDNDSFKVEKLASEITLTVTTNVEYEVTLPNWISEKSKTVLTDGSGATHVFTIAKNEGGTERNGIVKILSKGVSPTIEKIISVIQKGEYTNTDAASIPGDIKLKIVRGTTSSFQSGTPIEMAFDGKMDTNYHSAWSNNAPDYFPINLEFFLEKPETVDYMIYYPRVQGENGHFKQTEIWVTTETNSTYTKITDFDFKGDGVAKRVTFSTPVVGAKSFKIIVKSGHGDRQGFACAAEIEFWKRNNEAFNPLSIFTDVTCSELKTGITDEEIQAIANPFYKNIALYMKSGEYPSEFRIQEYRAWPSPDAIKQQNRMQYSYSNLDNPTGIATEQDEELVVFVGPTNGRNIRIKIMNLDMPNGDGFNQASYHPLNEGLNKIKAGSKGLIYLQYQTDDYASAPKIKVHFATGKVNGYYDKTKHTSSGDWDRLLGAATNKFFDVIGEHAHLCFPTENFRTYTGSKGKELIDIYDDMVNKTHIFSGTVGNRAMKNRAYFQVMYTAHMYCTAYRTSYNASTMSTLCNPDKLKNSIWGPAHELGHSHQVPPTFLWIGMTEVTVNMNSMNIQTAWNIPTRLETESMLSEGGYNNRYEKAYNIGIVPKKAFGDIGDVFCNLVSFWQLNLYFSKVKNDPQFYTKMYEAFRTTSLKSTLKDGEYQVDFTKTASQVAGVNLIPFFEKWGFYAPIDKSVTDYVTRQLTVTDNYANQIKTQINNLSLPQLTDRIEYICDSNWTYFRDRANVIKGSATKSGSRITMEGYKNVVAYEVYEGNDLIFVSNKNSFDMKRTPTANTKIYAIAYDGTQTEVDF